MLSLKYAPDSGLMEEIDIRLCIFNSNQNTQKFKSQVSGEITTFPMILTKMIIKDTEVFSDL